MEGHEFSTLAWIAMMFSTGMGIGLMFYGGGEPLQLYAAPAFVPLIGECGANGWAGRAIDLLAVFTTGPRSATRWPSSRAGAVLRPGEIRTPGRDRPHTTTPVPRPARAA
ncbi:hypothetical protein P3T39_005399 [Kitasatospora sp. GP82]|nr:hypothetical protein [Kitasatospora sp. GP82]